MKQINKLQWIVVALAILLSSVQINAKLLSYEISNVELNSIVENLTYEVSMLDTQKSVAEIDTYLNSFQAEERVVLMHLWLKKLSLLQDISEHHFNWIQTLVSSDAIVTSRFSDHPQKPIVLINIAEQAQSVLKINQIKQLARKIELQWQNAEFRWVDWLTGDPNNYIALVNWLTIQDVDFDTIKQSFIKNATPEQWPNNQILAIFIQRSPDPDLFSLLWQRDVDEFTYQAIHKLPNKDDSEFVVGQLVEAMKIKQLSSQALLSLAKHYPLDKRAQAAIEQSLSKPDQQWYALMALDKMDAPEFKKSLLIKLKQRPSRFTESATKMIERQMVDPESREQK